MATWQEEYKGVIGMAVAVLVAVAVVAWIFLSPLYQKRADLDARLVQARSDLERQRVFLPQYQSMQKFLEQGDLDAFPSPAPAPLPMAELNELPDELSRLAGESGLEVLDFVLSPGDMDQGRMRMQCVLMGGLEQFHDFHFSLGALPFLERIDRIEAQAVAGGMEFFVEFWIQVAASPSGVQG